MSIISDIYQAVDDTLSALYISTHQELYDPYAISNNDTKFLNRGYAFRFDPGVDSGAGMNHNLNVQKSLVLINTIVTRGTQRDTALRKVAEKQLFEDQFKGTQAILRGRPSYPVNDIQWVSDSGITFIFDDKVNYLAIETTFEVQYLEDIDFCR